MRSPERAEPLTLVSPVEMLPGVTRAKGEALRALGIPTLAHLVHHLPFRHERIEPQSPIGELKPGVIGSATGEVAATRVIAGGRRPRFQAVLLDHTGRLELVFFNQLYLTKRLQPGAVIRVQGKAQRFGPGGRWLQMVNPAWSPVEPDAPPAPAGGRWRPVYPASEACPSAFIDRVIQEVLDLALPLIEDHLPPAFRRERALPELREAYRMIHRPKSPGEVAEATRRLVYDELLLLQLGVRMKRAHTRRALHAPALRWSPAIDEHIRARLPFRLTAGQDRAVKEIIEDLKKSVPASRLIQGDVGAGKTAVALYAVLMAVASRHQAAIMAPTELLAEQHFSTIRAMLEGSPVRIALFTGAGAKLSSSARTGGTGVPPGPVQPSSSSQSSSTRSSSPPDFDIAIGTHALLGERVSFDSLAVAVIDEQHRFGVHQRARLRERSSDPTSVPHMLVMTATPIPRTLALTIFGDLDVSTIKGLPPGRMPITTRVVPESRAGEVYEYVRTRLDRGEQAYIVVPTIDGGRPEDAGGGEEPASALRTLRATQKMLEEGPFRGLRLAALHGRLKRETREAVMARFRAGAIHALVATTVIEVGVDVPAATIMLVHHADRFGLAQLHQLRGRIGRGTRRSLCVLIHSAEPTPEAVERLKAIASTSDGFKLAERDLELRGPGEIIGARQAGAAPFRLATFPRDTELLMMARRDAEAWIERSPALLAPSESLLRARLMKAHAESLGLADIG